MSLSTHYACPGVATNTSRCMPVTPVGIRRRSAPARGLTYVRATGAGSLEPDKSQPSVAAAANTAVPTESLAHLWPTVSWRRYHIQVLFVSTMARFRWGIAHQKTVRHKHRDVLLRGLTHLGVCGPWCPERGSRTFRLRTTGPAGLVRMPPAGLVRMRVTIRLPILSSLKQLMS
jgi:hypothetical protein